MEKLEQLIEDLSSLTVPQIVELTKKLEEKWGVKALPVVQSTGPVTTQPTEAKQEQTEFTVILTGFPADKKVSVIRVVREVSGLGLIESKALTESIPKEVKSGVDRATADETKRKLEEAGATVEVK